MHAESIKAWLWPFLIVVVATGCVRQSPEEVVVYAALDKEFSEPILDEFTRETRIRVLAKFDVESNKTVGLANEIINTASRPRVDVFWNNEILNTLRLEQAGLLDVYRSSLAENFPPQFVSSAEAWHGFAARARVLIVNKTILPDPDDWPKSISDIVDPKWNGKCGLAKPLFGTTATHAAVLFSIWGDDAAKQFFEKVKANAVIEGGNKTVAQHVAQGRYAFGLTDTDDAIIELEHGCDVAIVFPDQGDQQAGTLFIPNTLCIVKRGPNTANAKRLVDYLLQAKVEEQLAVGPSAQFPLNQQAQTKSRIDTTGVRMVQVDFAAAAEKWESAQQILVEIFR